MKKFVPLFAVLFLAGCADVDRGLYNLSDAVAPVDRVTGQRSLSLAGRAQQIENSNAMGDETIRQYKAAGKPVDAAVDAAQYARLQRVFQRVHAVSHLADEKWTAYLLPDDRWNAYTNGGTYIFVYEGLMKDLASDDELAAVIGHEIGHVSANHVYEQQAYVTAASLRGSKGAAKPAFQTAFTVTQEEEADQLGVLYAALAGYNPYAASRVWQKVYQKQGDMLSNHPANSDRFAATQKLAQDYSKYFQPGKINPQHVEILQSMANGGFGAQQVKPGEGGGLAAVLETAASVYGTRAQVKAEQQQQRATAAFTQYVGANVQLLSKRITDAHTLEAGLFYKGQYPVRNLNVMAVAGQERVSAHSDAVLPPMSQVTLRFVFAGTDLTRVNINTLPLAVVNAEQP